MGEVWKQPKSLFWNFTDEWHVATDSILRGLKQGANLAPNATLAAIQLRTEK